MSPLPANHDLRLNRGLSQTKEELQRNVLELQVFRGARRLTFRTRYSTESAIEVRYGATLPSTCGRYRYFQHAAAILDSDAGWGRSRMAQLTVRW